MGHPFPFHSHFRLSLSLPVTNPWSPFSIFHINCNGNLWSSTQWDPLVHLPCCGNTPWLMCTSLTSSPESLLEALLFGYLLVLHFLIMQWNGNAREFLFPLSCPSQGTDWFRRMKVSSMASSPITLSYNLYSRTQHTDQDETVAGTGTRPLLGFFPSIFCFCHMNTEVP